MWRKVASSCINCTACKCAMYVVWQQNGCSWFQTIICSNRAAVVRGDFFLQKRPNSGGAKGGKCGYGVQFFVKKGQKEES